jgi:hypothetical protein
MGDTIFLYTALYTTSLLLVGLLLTMREFTRLNGRGRPSLVIAQPAERLPADKAYGHVLRYS